MLEEPDFDDCWNRAGVSGDGTCPDLREHVHCRNCPVYAAAGRSLLDRNPPDGYVRDWTGLLAQEKKNQIEGSLPAMIFRLGLEWMALPVELFREVTPVRAVHRLPHRSNRTLLGLVNIRGEIMLCVSLKGLLGVEENPEDSVDRARSFRRMAVLIRERDQWVVPIDEIHGIERFSAGQLQKAPVTIEKAAVKFTKGMLPWKDKSVGLLDGELLFYALRRNAIP